jgi:hypothetical protein
MSIASAEYHRQWYADHREERQVYQRENMRRIRREEKAMQTQTKTAHVGG